MIELEIPTTCENLFRSDHMGFTARFAHMTSNGIAAIYQPLMADTDISMKSDFGSIYWSSSSFELNENRQSRHLVALPYKT